MLLLFKKSEKIECAQLVVSNLGEIYYLFVYKEINCKPLKLCDKSRRSIWHIPQKINELALLALAGRYT